MRVTDSAPSASEREWFESTVVELLPDLFGTALRLTRNRADAEDLVSDTVTRGWTRLHLRDTIEEDARRTRFFLSRLPAAQRDYRIVPRQQRTHLGLRRVREAARHHRRASHPRRQDRDGRDGRRGDGQRGFNAGILSAASRGCMLFCVPFKGVTRISRIRDILYDPRAQGPAALHG